MRVVVVTHYFPPISGPGAIKILGWASGWLTQGADVHVVTPEASPLDPYYQANEAYDERITVHRVPIFDVSRSVRKLKSKTTNNELAVKTSGDNQGVGGLRTWLLLPDHRRTAVRTMANLAKTLLRSRADLLVTTSPYNSTHLVGLKVPKHLRTWLADFRDDWLHPKFFPQRTAFHRWYNLQTENKVLSNADMVSMVAPQVREKVEARQSGIEWEKVRIIPNGAAVSRIESLLESAPIVESDKAVFRIVYAGTLWSCSHLDITLLAIKSKAEQRQKKVEIVFIGRIAGSVVFPETSEYFSVQSIGWVSYAEALAWQRSANLSLMHSGPEPESLVTKLFDAMCLRIPILWIGLTDSQGANLMKAHIANPLVCNDDNLAEVSHAFEQVLLASDRSSYGFTYTIPEYDRRLQGEAILEWAQSLKLE